MIVTCPRCFATYNVPATAVAAVARMVRCSSCRFEWTESPPPAEAIAALAPEMPEQLQPAAESQPLPPVSEPAYSTPRPARAASRTSPSRQPEESIFKRMGSKTAWVLFGVATVLCLFVLLREPLGARSLTLTDFYENIGLPVEGPEDWFRFEAVKLEKNEVSGLTVFSVHGRIVNQSRRDREVPNIKLFWRSARGEIGPVVILAPDTTPLAVGGVTAFSGELKGVDASRGGEVKVTFVTALEATVLKPGQVAVPASQPAANTRPAAVQPTPVMEPPAAPAPTVSTPSAPETSDEATQPAPAH